MDANLIEPEPARKYSRMTKAVFPLNWICTPAKLYFLAVELGLPPRKSSLMSKSFIFIGCRRIVELGGQRKTHIPRREAVQPHSRKSYDSGEAISCPFSPFPYEFVPWRNVWNQLKLSSRKRKAEGHRALKRAASSNPLLQKEMKMRRRNHCRNHPMSK